jgi:hypothetical protein
LAKFISRRSSGSENPVNTGFLHRSRNTLSTHGEYPISLHDTLSVMPIRLLAHAARNVMESNFSETINYMLQLLHKFEALRFEVFMAVNMKNAVWL